jgi:hypothetical protein
MVNEVDITGKAAQFGRGILTDVSKEIMSQFADNLRDVVGPPQSDDGASTSGAQGSPGETPSIAPLNAGSVIKGIGARRLREQPLRSAEVAAVLIVALITLRAVLGRRRNRG